MVSKNQAIQDFTGFQIHCACQHIQGLKHVHVTFGGFLPLRLPGGSSGTSSSSSNSSSSSSSGSRRRRIRHIVYLDEEQ